MNKADKTNTHNERDTLLLKTTLISTLICAFGLGIWLWIQNNRQLLPDPDSQAGKDLAGQYLGIAYDSFLIILLIVILTLTQKAIVANSKSPTHDPKNKPFGTRPLVFIRKNPISTTIFAAYTIVLLHEATWFHGELMGWMKELFENNLLNNFSIRYEFVNETLRRTDYRLFPLAHQDLHILSWFTPYVKVFMLASAAELITIVILSKRLIERISFRKNIPSLLLISSILLLFNASVGNAFFQLHFAERMVTFLFSIYCISLLNYQRDRDQTSFYVSIIVAILGIFFKDIAFILFIAPPVLIIIFRMTSLWEDEQNTSIKQLNTNTWKARWENFYSHNKLELWLCYLFLIFAITYIFLSLIPSTYLANESYADKSKTSIFNPDLRFWILASIASIRYGLILMGKMKANLLDAINFASILYAIALYFLISIEGYSYLYLPFVFASVLNILWVWTLVSGQLNSKTKRKEIINAIGVGGSILIVGLEHIDTQTSFYGHASRVHELHNSWEETYDTLDKLTRKHIDQGRQVNLIYSKDSWFSESRHLNRLRYNALIEWNPETNTFKIKDGTGESSDSTYSPKQGDFFINIDRTNEERMYPEIPAHYLNLIYGFNHQKTNRVNGQIFEINKINSEIQPAKQNNF